MKGRRVAVTGLGIVSPVGNSKEQAWNSICNGNSGVTSISRFDASNHVCKIAAQVDDFQDAPEFQPRHSRRTDLFIRYALAAAAEALEDSGLKLKDNYDPQRAGVIIGSGIGGLPVIEAGTQLLLEQGPSRVSAFFIPSAIVNMATGWVSMLYNLRGPNLAIATACTTGTHCIGEGARKIAYGDADIIVAGGSESTITSLAVAGFSASRALSVRNDDPQSASRPFDKDRDGFVLGEGAGILVLEEFEHAKARNADIYCELVGYGQSGDAYHITAPPEDGNGAKLAMENVVKDSGLATTDFDHVNAHGTSTMLGDIAETTAIKNLFGSHANNLSISATKSMTGHLLGAAGGIESVFTVLAMKNGLAPPTLNINEADPKCDLDYVSGTKARKQKIKVAITNSFGFGGTNASLAFAQSE